MSSRAEAIATDDRQEQPSDGDASMGPSRGGGKRRGWVGYLQIAGILGAVGLAVGFSSEGTAPADSAPVPLTAARAVDAPLVNVLVPEATVSRVTVAATGTVTVRNRVQLVPEVSGRIVAVSPALRAGGSFAAGEELLRIDPSDFRLALDQAEADLAVARSRLRLQRAEADAARANYALIHPDRPVPALVAKLPQIEQSQAQVAAAEARVAMAELELSRTSFSLPFAGRITRATAEIGQVLNEGQPFGETFALEALEVTVPIVQEDLARLTPLSGRDARVTAGQIEARATVERVAAELDERTRFAKLYLHFTGPTELPPGTFVDVILEGPELPNTFVLPGAAEQTNGNLWVLKDGELRGVTPRIFGRNAAGLLVEAFDAGDGVVVGPVPGGRDGLTVRTADAGA